MQPYKTGMKAAVLALGLLLPAYHANAQNASTSGTQQQQKKDEKGKDLFATLNCYDVKPGLNIPSTYFIDEKGECQIIPYDDYDHPIYGNSSFSSNPQKKK